jgi:aspartate racemase
VPRVTAAQRHETLGIIGGAGVAAAARLYSDVAAGFRSLHGRLPTIALWNLPFSDDLEHAFVSGVGVAEAERLVAESVERLIDAGATVIAMPCNSLQRVAAREAGRRGVPFVDMIEATHLDGTRPERRVRTAAHDLQPLRVRGLTGMRRGRCCVDQRRGIV